MIKRIFKSKVSQLLSGILLIAVSLITLGILLLGGEENAIIVLTKHSKPKVELPPPATSIFVEVEKESTLTEEDILKLIAAQNATSVKDISDPSKLPSNVPNFTGVGRLVSSGYHSTDLPYEGSSFIIAEMTPEFTVPSSFSLRTRIDKVLTYEQLKDYAEFTPVYTDVEAERPAIEMYMGFIFVDNGTSIDVYSNGGTYIRSFSDTDYIPAYTRDSNGNPLFYKMTTVESGQYDEESIEREPGDGTYLDREPHEKDETAFVHAHLKREGKGNAMTEEVKAYYTLSTAGYFVASEYKDELEGRGLYFNYPGYYGVPDSNVSLLGKTYDKYVKDIEGYVTLTHKVDWLFTKYGNPLNENTYERAYNFSEGLACVYTEAYYQDGGLFFVNASGNRAFNTIRSYNNEKADRYVIENYMPPITTGPESIGYFYFDHGYVRVRFETIDYWNYKDNNLKRVYTSEEVLINSKGEHFPIPVDYKLKGYSDGMLLLEKDGLYGFMDITGEWIAEPIYTYAEAFSEGLAVLKTPDGRYGMIDVNGKIVMPFAYKHLSSSSDGLFVGFSDENGWEIFKKMTK